MSAMNPAKGEALTAGTVKASGETSLDGERIDMNSTSIETEILALLRGGARGVMVTPGQSGQGLTAKAIAPGQSVVNLETELLDHLDSYPHSSEWLTDLRDYLDQRLAARAEVKRTGGVSMPSATARYILHVHARTLEA